MTWPKAHPADDSLRLETNGMALVIRESEVLERQATHLVGTLGHVSEGKSTLVRALTGVRTQRYAAEQHRNITIHLGYANCKIWQNTTTGELHAGPSAPATTAWQLIAHLSFVDCPGHEAYLATMLGGASVMDTACLLVAVNEPAAIPQPQTLEHLMAAELTGTDRIAVLPNKLDLIDASGMAVATERIRTLVADTVADPAHGAPMFPIAAQHGWGVERVLNWLVSLPPPPRDLTAPAAFTCVRSFDVNRPGPYSATAPLAGGVLGGPLDRGVVAVGDWLEIRPGVLRRGSDGGILVQPLVTRVTGIRCEGAALPYAVPGSLVAIATELDPALAASNGMVGQRVGVPGTLPPIVEKLTLQFRRLKRDTHPFEAHRIGDPVRICSGVLTVEGRVTAMEGRRVITVTLQRPLCVREGETVSLLRQHPVARRELLEGIGKVLSTADWPRQVPAEGIDAAVPPARTIEWVPLVRPEFASPPLPRYEELVADVLGRKATLAGLGELCLVSPVIDRIPKHTVVTNWEAVADRIVGADSAHLQAFLQDELSTTGSVNARGHLILRGFWKVDDLRTLLVRYVATYKECRQCHGFNTERVTLEGGVEKVRCARCRTDNPVVLAK